jgi:hypothetical protein
MMKNSQACVADFSDLTMNMNLKTLLAAALTFCLLAAHIQAEDSALKVPMPITSKLRPLETSFNFGHVGIEYDLFHTFHLVNTSQKPIRLDTAAATCDCSIVTLRDSIADPGDTIELYLKFNTKNYFGPTSRSILIVTNEPSTYKINYTADVGQWPYFAKPDPIAFFMLPAHQSLTMKIPNTVDLTSRLSGIVQQDTNYVVTVTQKEARKNQSIELTITPKTSLKRGTFQSSLRLSLTTSDSPDTTHVAVPVKIVRY